MLRAARRRAVPLASTPSWIYLPHLLNVAKELELAWNHALPGREVVERDQVLREICRLLTTSPAPRVWFTPVGSLPTLAVQQSDHGSIR